MQGDPTYDDVASDVAAFLEERLAASRSTPGSTRSASCLDPGSASARPWSRTSSCAAAGRAASPSAGRWSSASRARARSAASSATRRRRPAPLSASLAAAVAAYERGATILRAHDVRETVEALTVARAVYVA